MSSIVSRRPPVSGSTSHSKERRWMSIRLGRSRTLSRRAKLRRVRRGASRAGTTATPQGRWRRANWEGATPRGGRRAAPCQSSTGRRGPPFEGLSALTDPARAPAYVARDAVGGRLRLLADRGRVAVRGRARHRPRPRPPPTGAWHLASRPPPRQGTSVAGARGAGHL